jgi:pyruvate kinase
VPGAQVAIMLDTKGPEIRTGLLAGGASVELKEGQDLEIYTDYATPGDATRIACSYPTLPTSVKVGSSILIADGTLMCTVKELRAASVLVRVCNNVKLGEKKNMNLPGVIVDLPTITEKDKSDLVDFGVKYNVDMVAASFVRKGSDIAHIRETLGPAGRHIKIIAKIENQEGLHNYDEILAAADGIMVARGDLGMEIPIEKVFLAQKMMIRKANLAGKTVITATQMLESMITNARPTRAECSDVANAVLDGTDCVMLSGETANGSHPLAALSYMARTCVEAEGIVNYAQLFAAIRESTLAEVGAMSIAEAVASSAVKTAIDMGAKAIIVCSETGNTARLVAKYRPPMRVLVLTGTEAVARQVSGLTRNAVAVVMGSMVGTDSIVHRAEDMMKEKGWVASGDCVVAVHGQIEGRPGSTSLCRVLTVV